MKDKEEYRKLCKSERTIPIFSKDWWLDVVCGENNWQVVVIKKGSNVVASLPYYLTKDKFGFKRIAMPLLTQTMGVWIKYPEQQKYDTRVSYEKKIFTELLEELPGFDMFTQNFHYSITNWLPFYWKGFSQTTRYTYLIEDLSDLDKVFLNFDSDLRTKIKKAKKSIRIYEEEDIRKLFDMTQKTFDRQGLETPYSFEFLLKLDKACSEQNGRKIFFAEDEKGKIHAGIFIVCDEQSVYPIAGGADPSFRNSGANPLLCWEVIKFASTVSKKFDFAGSMIEPIECFMRSFGGVQKPYFRITKINSKFLKLRNYLTEFRDNKRVS